MGVKTDKEGSLIISILYYLEFRYTSTFKYARVPQNSCQINADGLFYSGNQFLIKIENVRSLFNLSLCR